MRRTALKGKVCIDPRMVYHNAADSALGVGPAADHLQVDEFGVVQEYRLIHRDIGQKLVGIITVIRTGKQEQKCKQKKDLLHLLEILRKVQIF